MPTLSSSPRVFTRRLALMFGLSMSIVIGAYSIGSTETETEFWLNEYKRQQGGSRAQQPQGWRAQQPREEPRARVTVTPRTRAGATTDRVNDRAGGRTNDRASGWSNDRTSGRGSGWSNDRTNGRSNGRTNGKASSSSTEWGSVGPGHYCVRTCDGYYFPLSSERLSAAQMQSLCRSLCPAATSEIYTRRNGSDAIDDAVSAKGRRYSQLAKAFAYREGNTPACTCQSDATQAMSVMEDPTLRPGDIVVSEDGARVFRGGSLPHQERDFVDYRRTRSVSGSLRTHLDAVTLVNGGGKLPSLSKAKGAAARAKASAPLGKGRRWIQMPEPSAERSPDDGGRAEGQSPDAIRIIY